MEKKAAIPMVRLQVQLVELPTVQQPGRLVVTPMVQ
jgi:hypothetical protein